MAVLKNEIRPATWAHIVNIYITPDDLRRWADAMEDHWKKSLVGDSLMAVTILGDGVEVCLKIDQERMQR